MASKEATWTSDWEGRLRARLADLGYDSICEFLTHTPGEPYTEVVKRIAPWVAVAQLSRLQMQEAKRRGELRAAAMDSLARNLNGYLPDGWVPDSQTESKAAGAAANTSTSLVIEGESPELRAHILEVYRALKSLAPPIGWRPLGANDPRIEEAFARGWPPTASTT